MLVVFAAGLPVQGKMLAQESSQTLQQMLHSSWSGRDGAPQFIYCMAQTPNGLLWIGTSNGLFTFDGKDFSHFHGSESEPRLPSLVPFWILVSHEGDVWLFYPSGPAARIRDNHVSLFDKADGKAVESVTFPQLDSTGKIWAIQNGRQLVRLGDDRVWHQVPALSKEPRQLTMLFIDSADTVWTVADNQLLRSADHGGHFDSTGRQVFAADESVLLPGKISVAEGQANDLWIAAFSYASHPRLTQVLQHISRDGTPLPAPKIPEKPTGVLTGKDGSLWLDQAGTLLRLGRTQLDADAVNFNQKSSETIALSEGAQSIFYHDFIRGNDGSVWVGGLGGLEHFSESALVPSIPKANVGWRLSCLGPEEDLWYTDTSKRLYRLKDGNVIPQNLRSDVQTLYCSNKGELAVTKTGIAVWKSNNVPHHLPEIPQCGSEDQECTVTGAVLDSNANVIAATQLRRERATLWRFDGTEWKQFFSRDGPSEISAIKPLSNEEVLIGFRNGPPLLLNRELKLTGALSAPGLGYVAGFSETRYGTFAYGMNGVAQMFGSTFRMLSFAKPDHCLRVSGMAEDRNGDLWLNGGSGIIKIPAGELLQLRAEPNHKLASINIREGDIVGPAILIVLASGVQVDRGGRVWFSTPNGPVSLDPSRLQHLSSPPLVSIRSIRGDGAAIGQKASFPPDLATLNIEYIGVELNRPREVSYRYRLFGSDTDWQDAGTRTEARYTHLRPGRYQFKVMASNAYGYWSEPTTSVSFTVLPHFYQTLWFQVALACAVVLLLVFGIRTRLALVAADIRNRAEERADERISIARDLHDTLLQSIHGLLMTFHSAAEQVPSDHHSRKALDRALVVADRVVLEGRSRVAGLRTSANLGMNLQSALEALGQEGSGERSAKFIVQSDGDQRPLCDHAADEIFMIAREAITNALRHANATSLRVDLSYGLDAFTLCCVDDGRGFSVADAQKMERLGHWGVRGMRERAQKLSATLSIETDYGRGTMIRLVVPGKKAFRL